MSPLKARLTDDMKNAMRAHDSAKLMTIRFLLSAIKNWEIDNGEQDDAGVEKVIGKEVKRMKDALGDYQKAGRPELVEQQEAEIQVMESYLPQQLSDDEVQKIVNEVVATADKKDFGFIMKSVMAKTQGRVDGSKVSALVKNALA